MTQYSIRLTIEDNNDADFILDEVLSNLEYGNINVIDFKMDWAGE